MELSLSDVSEPFNKKPLLVFSKEDWLIGRKDFHVLSFIFSVFLLLVVAFEYFSAAENWTFQGLIIFFLIAVLFVGIVYGVLGPLFWLVRRFQEASIPQFADYEWLKIYDDYIYMNRQDHTGKPYIVHCPLSSIEGVCVVVNTFLKPLQLDKITKLNEMPKFYYWTGSSVVLKKKANTQNLYVGIKIKSFFKFCPSNIWDKVSNGRFGLNKRINAAKKIAEKTGLPYLGLQGHND